MNMCTRVADRNRDGACNVCLVGMQVLWLSSRPNGAWGPAMAKNRTGRYARNDGDEHVIDILNSSVEIANSVRDLKARWSMDTAGASFNDASPTADGGNRVRNMTLRDGNARAVAMTADAKAPQLSNGSS